MHSLKLVDYLCELKKLGCELEKTELEYDFGGVIPDAFVIFKFNGYRYYQLVEMQLRHDNVDVDRYSKVIKNISALKFPTGTAKPFTTTLSTGITQIRFSI